MTGASRLMVGGLLAAALLFAGLGFVAFRALEPTQVSPTGGAAGGSCSPEPCINAGPFEVDVVRYSRDASPIAAGELLRLDILFRNHSNDPVTANGNHERADLLDFSLLDASRREYRPDYSPTRCAHWDSYEIPQFQDYGPRPVCFSVGSPGGAAFVLRWNPDLGLLSHAYDLHLP